MNLALKKTVKRNKNSTECPKSKLTREKRSQTLKNYANAFKFSDLIVKTCQIY